jgi:hypothetical protein
VIFVNPFPPDPRTPRSNNMMTQIGTESQTSSTQFRTSLIKTLKALHRVGSLCVVSDSHSVLFADIVLGRIIFL